MIIAYTKREIHIKKADQIDNLSDHDINILMLQSSARLSTYQEREDGRQYQECLEMLNSGDVFRVAYLDDISESVIEVMVELDSLKKKGVTFQCTANRFNNDPYQRFNGFWPFYV